MSNINDNERQSQSQYKQILAYMKSGNKITQMDALHLCGCFRLASRIHDLREKGYDIKAEKITTLTGKRVCQYSLQGN